MRVMAGTSAVVAVRILTSGANLVSVMAVRAYRSTPHLGNGRFVRRRTSIGAFMAARAASLHALNTLSLTTRDLTNLTLPRSIDVAGAENAARTERHGRRGKRGVSHEQLVRG